MKTLIFVGSPHRNGHTMALVNAFTAKLVDEYEIINVFDYADIRPCVDCGYCQRKPGCSINDRFTEILQKIEAADAFVIASPMWFGTVSGPLLAFFSRLQTISCGFIFRKDRTHRWDKAGVFLMTTGSKWHSMAKSVETTVEFIFSHLDAGLIDFVYATQTDQLPASQNQQALVRSNQTAERLNVWMQDKAAGRYYQYLYNSVNYLPIANKERKESHETIN